MQSLRERADYVIDTSTLQISKLQRELYRLFASSVGDDDIAINVLSFGYKFGIPTDADLVFDVRFLPNPYYIGDLRSKTGLENSVRDYIFSAAESREFMSKLTDMIDFLLPMYIEEGKRSLVIAIGCTGGRHRSVAVSHVLYEHLLNSGYKSTNSHRDIDKS